MKTCKRILKCLLLLIAIPVSYFTIAFLLTSITVNKDQDETAATRSKTIYLSTNGVHLDIIIPKKDIAPHLLEDIVYQDNEEYISFGWGNENFYINTPTWGDLTVKNAFQAMFLNGPTLMHVTRYRKPGTSWTEIHLQKKEFDTLNTYILNSFRLDNNHKIILPDAGYTSRDNFYKATGGYSCLMTCNTWVNLAFKESGLKACYWTPFDFGLIDKYKE
jgi:uncharacterized protein (TIGR02117 family)